MVLLWLSNAAYAGPVILGGDDLTDHGMRTGGVSQLGWRYIENAISNLNATATRPGAVGIAALGAAATACGPPVPPADCNDSDAGSAIGSVAADLSIPITFYDGATAIDDFFDELEGGLVNPKIIWLAGVGAKNNLDPMEGEVLTLRAFALNSFVASGGGLMAHGYGVDAYGWLATVLPGLDGEGKCRSQEATLTPAGAAAFPSLADTDLRGGPCHMTFIGDLGDLEVLALDSLGLNFIIGSALAQSLNGCGNNLVDRPGEECDGTDDAACPGQCTPSGDPLECRCPIDLDHFKCYKAKLQNGAPKFASTTVSLADQFESKVTRAIKPKLFCNPVSKNSEPMFDPTAHLTCYSIRDARQPPQPKFGGQNALVQNQFGPGKLTAQKSKLVCVPSEKNGVPSALNLSHFKCYKAKTFKEFGKLRRKLKFAQRQVTLDDQFESKITRVVKPKMLCNPVSKNGEAIPDLRAHLACYKIKDTRTQPRQPKFVPVNLTASNQLGNVLLTAKKPKFLCVPSLKSEF